MFTRSQLLSVVTVLLVAGSVLHAQTFPGPMPTGSARTLTTESAGSILNAGVAVVDPIASDIAPAGFALIRYRPNGVLISETSIPISAITHFARIYVEAGGAVNTGVAIANPTAHPTEIRFSFMDLSGAVVKTGSTQLFPQTRVTRFVTEAPFSLKGPFIGTMTITSHGPPVSIIAIRGFTNERSEFLLSSVPVVEQGPGPDWFLPHYANGGGWTTQMVLINSTDQPISGTFQFLNNERVTGDNQPIEIVVDGQSDSSFTYSIPPGSARTFHTSGAPSNVQVGSIRLIQASDIPLPVGHVILSFKRDGITVTEESVAGAPRPTTLHRMYVEEDIGQQIQTGIAIFNPSEDNTSVTLNLTDSTGQPTGLSATVGLGAFRHTAKFLREIPGFETLPPTFKGVLQIWTHYRFGFSFVGLRTRYNERGDLLVSSIAPAPEGFDPAGSSRLMASPHVVSGGGYTTELVFFSVGSDAPNAVPTSASLGFITDATGAIEFIPPLE